MGNKDFWLVIRSGILTFRPRICEKECAVVALHNFKGLLTDAIVVQIHEMGNVLKTTDKTSNKGFGFRRFHVKLGLSLVK